jgi:hypothetical protein
MQNTYILKNAITFNPNGKKHNAVASIATLKEIKQHKAYFGFDFENFYSQGIMVYKICKEGESDLIQGLVAFTPSLGILDCYNMEMNNINKRGSSLYTGLGKCMIALCCKISFDLGFDGFITFEAKNRLIPYYERYGAKSTGFLRMAIDSIAAQKLVDFYF